MAETSKNKIYYNDNENSVADVLADMKKMAESTDKAIENSKYNDATIKKNISDIEEKQSIKDSEQDRKIVELQNEKAALETELKEIQEDFYQNSIRGQASGEYIHVEDSSNCRAKIGIGGNHEQEMRSGKNYLNTFAKYKAGDTVTVEGITYTFNDDGSITLNGTASATANSNLDISQNIQTISGTNKKIIGFLTGSQVPSKIALIAYTSNFDTTAYLTFSEVNKSLQSKMKENKDYTLFRITVYSGTTVNNQTVYYQILDTSETDLTYEQYGVSPSPGYPAKIKSVGSNVNIFDANSENISYSTRNNTEKYEINNSNSITVNSSGTWGRTTVTISKLKPNTKYTIRTIILNEKQCKSGLICNDTNNDNISSISTENNFSSVITAISDEKGKLTIQFFSNWSGTTLDAKVTFTDIKLVEGTEVGEYSKHGQGCVKVTKCNKNILKNIATSGALNGITRTVNEDGSVTINGTSTGWANLTVGTIKGDGNSYTLSGSLSNSEIFLSVNNSQEGDIAQSKNGNEITFIPKKGLTYNVIICIPSGKTFNNVLIKPLVRISSDKDNTFEQHEEQSCIMPVQQEMLEGDTFDYNNEEEVHTWGKLVLNGTEKIGISGASTDEILVVVYDINNAIDGFGYSNCFLYSSQVALNKLNVYNNGKNLRVCVDKSKLVDLESFKSKIIELYNAGTPVMIYYKLQTPTRLAFTDEQKEVAKELSNARTYKNVTNITTDSKAILSLDYAKDLETLLTSKESEV